MGPIRDQLKGDCWAHAAVAVIDAQLTARNGTFHGLSVQELYDCSDLPQSTEIGGNPYWAYKYVKKSKRLGYELDIPETITEERASCVPYKKSPNALTGYKIAKVELLEESYTSLLYHVHYVSPVAVSIETKESQLKYYKGGLYKNVYCWRGPDHAVVVVAYDEKMLIIRNSWGADWGNDGHLWWSRFSKICSILTGMSVPYLEERNGDWSWPWPFKWNQLK